LLFNLLARQSRNQKNFIGHRWTQINTDFISAKDLKTKGISDTDEHGYTRILPWPPFLKGSCEKIERREPKASFFPRLPHFPVPEFFHSFRAVGGDFREACSTKICLIKIKDSAKQQYRGFPSLEKRVIPANIDGS
jgi:hypothetical protein